MNLKRTQDISPAIRLPRQTTLPSPKDVIDMSNESRRSKKRVELPWQPDGRPEPVVLTVRFDELTGKANWMLFDGIKSDACVVWSAADPDPTKVVLAMRDWYTTARMAEGWGNRSVPDIQPKQHDPMKVTHADGARTAAAPGPADGRNAGLPAAAEIAAPLPSVTPRYAYPSMVPPGYTPGQPFPTMPGYTPGQAFPAMTQPPAAYPPGTVPPYAAPTPAIAWPAMGAYPAPPGYPPATPPHWAHGYPQPQPAADFTLAGATAPGVLLLGDLLVAAGVIPTRTLQAALTLQNTSQMERRRIGEILVNAGALPRNVVQAAVKLQDMARQGSIPSSKVTELLRRVHSTGTPVENLIVDRQAAAPSPTAGATTNTEDAAKTVSRQRPSDELLERESQVSEEDQKKLRRVMSLLKKIDFSGADGSEKAVRLFSLLKQADVVNDTTFDTIRQSSNTQDTVKSLLVKEAVDPLAFEAGLQCQKLIETERLKPEQAIIAIGYCQRSRITLREAISDLNWLIPMEDV